MSSLSGNAINQIKAFSEGQDESERNKKLKINKSNSNSYKISQKENIKNLKKNLLEGSYEYKIIEKFEKENLYYSELINTNKIIDENVIKVDSKFDDEIFEEKVNQIFANEFNLELLDLFPYFEVVNSKKKYKKVTQISYFIIKCNCNTDKKYVSYYFLYNRDIFIFNYLDLSLLLSKSEGLPSSITVILKNFDDYREFKLNKNGKIYELSFQYKDINPEIINVLKNIEKLKEEQKVNTNEDEKTFINQKLIILQNIKKMLEKKYDEKEIISKKVINKNEILLLDEEIKYNKIINNQEKVQELNNQKNLIEKKISEYDTLLKTITIRIEKVEKELEGFYYSTKQINLTNSIDDKLVIPSNRPIIVEVKNNFNYQKIIDNIREKKK